jgi:hypothetical protein
MAAPVFTLTYVAIVEAGAFGVLAFGGVPFAVTLARTYPERPAPCCYVAASGQAVKLPPGRYRCTRTVYHKYGYATFEIHIPGHERVLFHVGNLEDDSDGCVLVGERFDDFNPAPGIGESRAGFKQFMIRAADLQAFTLEVLDASALPVVA